MYVNNKYNPYKHNIVRACCGEVLREDWHKPETFATCQKKALCSECKSYYGETLEHVFSNASCTYPKTCFNCDYTEGDLLPHTGGQAGCQEQAICEVCNVPYGDVLGHGGGEATCTKQATCVRCGVLYGAPLAHTGGVANCQSGAICQVCGTVYGEIGAHVVDEKWIVEDEFHYQACSIDGCDGVFNDADHIDGNKDGKCDICSHKYKLSQAQLIWIIVGSSVGGALLIGLATFGAITIIKRKKKNKEMV